jgi:CRP/FNR family transcriptional regulator, cyclic AMP receptor protein
MLIDVEAVLSTSRCFGGDLPPPLIAQVVACSWTVRKPTGANLQYVGEPLYAVYLLLEGFIRVSRTAPNGRELLLSMSGPGHLFNLGPLLSGGACTITMDAASDVTLLLLPADELLLLADNEPVLMKAIARTLARHERHALELLESAALQRAPARLAGLLLHDAERHARGRPQYAYNQAELAARLGSVREVVARTLRDFVRRGLIRMEKQTITILDRDGLQHERMQ